MISISTFTQNTSGAIVIKENASSKLKENISRVSRSKTLDGGVHIIHSGVSDGDRTLKIKSRISLSNENILWAIYNDETFLLISFTDGLYNGVIENMKINKGDLNMTFLILESEV